jgi:hypothetical protein
VNRLISDFGSVFNHVLNRFGSSFNHAKNIFFASFFRSFFIFHLRGIELIGNERFCLFLGTEFVPRLRLGFGFGFGFGFGCRRRCRGSQDHGVTDQTATAIHVLTRDLDFILFHAFGEVNLDDPVLVTKDHTSGTLWRS